MWILNFILFSSPLQFVDYIYSLGSKPQLKWLYIYIIFRTYLFHLLYNSLNDSIIFFEICLVFFFHKIPKNLFKDAVPKLPYIRSFVSRLSPPTPPKKKITLGPPLTSTLKYCQYFEQHLECYITLKLEYSKKP